VPSSSFTAVVDYKDPTYFLVLQDKMSKWHNSKQIIVSFGLSQHNYTKFDCVARMYHYLAPKVGTDEPYELTVNFLNNYVDCSQPVHPSMVIQQQIRPFNGR
jgi:hypothetical protein